MLKLFLPFRRRVRPELAGMFDTYLASLRDFEDQDIGGVLDLAREIKDATIADSGNPDYALLFERPSTLSENFAFRILRLWRHQMMAERGTLEGRAKIGALMIWYLTLAAAHFPEFWPQAQAIWRELERGYDACKFFDPAADAIIGLGSS